MSVPFARASRLLEVTIGATESATDEIDLRSFAGGSFEVPSGSSITTLTLYCSCQSGSGRTHVQAYDVDEVVLDVTSINASQVRSLPPEVFDFPYIKLVGNSAGTISLYLVG